MGTDDDRATLAAGLLTFADPTCDWACPHHRDMLHR